VRTLGPFAARFAAKAGAVAERAAGSARRAWCARRVRAFVRCAGTMRTCLGLQRQSFVRIRDGAPSRGVSLIDAARRRALARMEV
jgi:hypothetical protein